MTMSSIVKTEAVVLKSMKYRETSKIVTFYTRDFGKVRAIAKGARQSRNKFGSSLEPMSYVLLVLYRKEHRDLQLVSQCDLIKSFRHLSEDLGKMAVCMSAIELVEKVSHDEEKNEQFFQLLIDLLSTVNSATQQPWNVLYGFEIRLSGILGFQPNFEKCALCGKAIIPGNKDSNSVVFHLSKGGPLCSTCVTQSGFRVSVSSDSLKVLIQLASFRKLEEIVNFEFSHSRRPEIESLLIRFLQFHIEGLQNLKAEKVLSRVLA